MATWAVGDIQGCLAEFDDLLARIAFRPASDVLWLVGDLVNRGPDSLGVMRRVMSLPNESLVTVLGNHDLHLLAIIHGGHSPNRLDTFTDVLEAPDRDEIAAWLRAQPLFAADAALGYAMAHAGVPPAWSLDAAAHRAGEVERAIRGPDRDRYFERLYGNKPATWADSLEGMDRLRLITNCFTRMRLIDAAGTLEFAGKGSPAEAPPGWRPWFETAPARPLRLLFGHWAALEGRTGRSDIIGLDTGCVWGRTLTAYCLETGEYRQVDAHH